MKEQPRIIVDIDLSDDAMGVENAADDASRYLQMLEAELQSQYPNAEISFTHRGNGDIDLYELDAGEVHNIIHIINAVWEEWLEAYE